MEYLRRNKQMLDILISRSASEVTAVWYHTMLLLVHFFPDLVQPIGLLVLYSGFTRYLLICWYRTKLTEFITILEIGVVTYTKVFYGRS